MPRVDTNGIVKAAAESQGEAGGGGGGAMASAESSQRRAGDHATVEVLSDGQLQLILNVPFELPSMSEAELDISAALVVLRGPASLGKPEVSAPLPKGFELDPDQAMAKYSKKRRQLSIVSPNRGTCAEGRESPKVAGTGAAASAAAVAAATGSRGTAEATNSAATTAAPDSPPAAPMMNGTSHAHGQQADLVDSAASDARPDNTSAAVEASSSAAESLATPSAPKVVDWQTEPEVNDIAQQMMMKALAAKDKKKKQTEEDRKSSNMSSGGGLKKGFLSGAKISKSKPSNGKEKKEDDIPFIGFSGNSAEDAKRNSLKFEEVQQQLQQGTEMLKNDQSWVTPQLMAALQARPDLQKAMQDPKVLEAIGLFQTDPTLAQQKYKNDPEVSKFMKEFMSLMATHFSVLGAQADSTKKPQSQGESSSKKASSAPAPPPSTSREIVLPSSNTTGEPALEELGFAPVPRGSKTAPLNMTRPTQPEKLSSEELTRNLDPNDPLAKALSDPRVADAWQDPEVQKVIQEVRAGRQLEMREFARDNPRTFMKMKYLLDAGLMGMAA
mmetsp:Transcript_52825/g.115469  ORF Transcript_52825/g.115469 Transcript_52825/m.115469 type:complete len:556 (-) Transcript_52825:222-1889(-)|eukprot:CAMPEP_0206432978 /NCGR_PEP_ID=MMETSP0324_2-20121206/8266_1 /ASSEMBLY_ACC=CAM_ASM_000836 /TAXON_ID=2866 /ORGANISM="Crypthecodinium cohnii, Strain Seligo" /LENGTH=555 /DNA_ID=CAMNT_0053899169 /DNA_START=75 /DNA_END=1742 /DNA_ORIENTATION=-